MVNIATTFVAPLRQRPDRPAILSEHRQPYVTDRMVEHLRKLPLRDDIDRVGLEALCTFVVNVDNQGSVALHTDRPAPQPGDPDQYDTFLERICRCYTERFGDLSNLPADGGLTLDEALRELAVEHPGLLSRTAELGVEARLEGSTELEAILRSIDVVEPAEG